MNCQKALWHGPQGKIVKCLVGALRRNCYFSFWPSQKLISWFVFK